MAADSLRARHPKKRIKLISLQKVYRSVWNHPFVVVMLLFLICLHQYFPSAFALLVSVSPIIICTAVLLGVILVHGQPNDHRVESEGGLSSTISSERTGVADHSSSAERDRIFSNNRFAEVRNNIVAKNMEVPGMVGAGIKVVDNPAEQVDWENCNSKLSQGKGKAGFHLGHFEDKDFQMPETQAQNLVGKHDKMLQVNGDAGMREKLDNKLDTLVYQNNHVNAAAHHDCSDSESDGRRKPFVNDFVVHSIPTPQEIHPLLHTEDLLLHNQSHDASPKFETQSLESNISNGESDEEVDYTAVLLGVIICTAVLLGIILVHGQPNDQRVEYDGGLSSTISSERTGVADHSSSAERDRIFSNNRFAEVRNNIVAKNMEVSGMVGAGIKVVDNLTKQVDWEYCNSKLSQGKGKAGFHFGHFEDKDFPMPEIQAQNLVGKHDRMLQVNGDAGMRDKLDNKLDTFVYQYNHVNAAAHHDCSDSESDGRGKPFVDDFIVHSISPPQEIHPLLDTEDRLLHNQSHDASPKFETQSLGSSISNGESDEEVDYIVEEAEDEVDDDDDGEDDDDDDGDDETPEAKNGGERSAVAWTEDDQKVLQDLTCSEMEKNEQLESLIGRMSNEINNRQLAEETGVSEDVDDDDDDGDDDDNDDDYDDDDGGGKKDGNKPVTLWTEEDEKNLRALGTSELERNLRLENLLARRRVQRTFSMISERNLIDLDFSDLPFQVAPISTSRVNPFDTPGDTNPHDNVPPIPGSAPSIALRRKNPFDSPSTSPKRADNPIEECPEEESMETDLKNEVFHTNASSSTDYSRIEDVFEPKFTERGEKEASLRRHESFNLGYDFMVDASGSGQDFLEVDQRNAVFRRHESFSARPAFSSILTRDKPNRRQWRPIFVPKQLAREEVMHPSLERQSSQDSGSAVSSGSDSESFSSREDWEHIGSNEEESSTSELHQIGEETTTANNFPSDSESESESEYSEAVEDDEDEHFGSPCECKCRQ